MLRKSDNTISVIFSCRQFLSAFELTACSEAFFVPVMMLYNHQNATDGSNFNSDLISQQNVTCHGVCIDDVLS